MNVVILTGRLTAEPELRYTQQNVPCTSFNLAVDRASKGDDADFPTIIAWRETAEFACKYLYKGSNSMLSRLLKRSSASSCFPCLSTSFRTSIRDNRNSSGEIA